MPGNIGNIYTTRVRIDPGWTERVRNADDLRVGQVSKYEIAQRGAKSTVRGWHPGQRSIKPCDSPVFALHSSRLLMRTAHVPLQCVVASVCTDAPRFGALEAGLNCPLLSFTLGLSIVPDTPKVANIVLFPVESLPAFFALMLRVLKTRLPSSPIVVLCIARRLRWRRSLFRHRYSVGD